MLNVKSYFILLLTFIFICPTIAVSQRSQSKKNTIKSAESPFTNQTAKTGDKAQAAFEALKSAADAAERIEKLNKFIADFPRSELKIKAIEMLIISHLEIGETSFRNGDKTSGAAHFRRAAGAFEPAVGDGIFNDVIAKLPFNLFFRGEQSSAFEVAREIEPKLKDSAPRLLTLANFYLSIESSDDAKRLATRAAEIAPDSAAAQMSLGMAQRIAFHLEAAAQAYTRAVELDPASATAKRNLADTWRGLGQTEDALKLYREILNLNAADEAARNGLILTLFNAGNKDEAEKELSAALAQNSKNLILQTGAAYWYAANGDGRRAIELAQRAVETEPRYVWGQIALARGLILEKRPLDAERALITAGQYGKFPTLDYELANAHFAAGLYDEATDDLRRSFTFKNGRIATKLAGRSQSEAENFIELLSRERRASIFEPTSAGSEIEARKLKELLTLAAIDGGEKSREESNENFDENAFVKAAQDFAADADDMQVHRQLYAANKLLNRKIATGQILELTRSATGGLEKSLDVPSATAAVLAGELYEPRRLAAASGNIVNIPVLPRETLRQIMRGRVEEIAGWSLYQQNKLDEAATRLRRAVGVLPENSAWWRSSYWKLGSALDASGKSKEALAAYLKSYRADAPNETRLIIIQALYERVYGSLNGLAEKLNQTETANSGATLNQTAQQRSAPPSAASSSAPFKNPLPSVIATINSPKVETLKSEIPSRVETKLQPALNTTAQINLPATSSVPTPEIKNETSAVVVPRTSDQTNQTPETIAAPSPESEPINLSTPATETKLEAKTETKLEAKVADQSVSNPENKIEDKPEEKTENKTETIETPVVESSPIQPLSEIKLPPPLEPIVEPTISTVNNSTEKKTDEKNQEKTVESVATETSETSSALDRPRVIIRSINPPRESVEQPESGTKSAVGSCLMQASLSEVSILRNGGTVAFLVTFADAADAAKLKVSVNSPTDINVILLSSDDPKGDHRLIQISSISEITKTYTITLESPCGKQEIKVKVR